MKLFEAYYYGDEDNINYLYHATYKPLIKSIQKNGLGGKGSEKKRWEDSKNVIYLSKTPEVAYSYAETSETVPDSWLDQIIVFQININKLNLNKLSIDRNVLDNNGETLEYDGIINWNDLELTNYAE